MKPGMKLLMIANRRNQDHSRRESDGREYGRGDARQNHPEMAYDREYETRGNYNGINNRSNYIRNEWEYEAGDVENRFRDRRGRDHYDNGRFAPMRSEIEEPEDNYGAEMRRRRDSRGRFRSEGNYGVDMHYPYTPFIPPVYERGGGQMNLIGFERREEVPNNYGMSAEHQSPEEMRNQNSNMEMGRASGNSAVLNKEMAEEWMMGLQNEDGTKGPHWSMEQAKQIMTQRGISTDPMEFWVILNAVYSDYCKVFKKHNMDRADVYADFAAAWLNDKDAQPHKAGRYFSEIVKH